MASGGYKGASPARETSPEQYPGVWELTEQFQAQADGNWPFQETDCAPKSLRFDEASVSNLTKTFASAGNRRVFTWNFWVKLAKLSENNIAVVGSGSPNSIRFNADGSLQIKACGGNLTTSARFRDFSAWYGITVAVNSTASVASDRIKLFVNGKDFTSTLTGTTATLDGEANWNTAATHYIGKQEHNNSNMLDGLLSEVTFIDGQALSCEEFGFFDGQGIWQPKRFTGDYSSGPDWNNFISGTQYNTSRSLDKTFDGLNNTYSAAAGGETITFAPVPAITGITKVKLRVFKDNSTTTDITLNGNVITSSFTAGQYSDAEFTVNNLTELKWTTNTSNMWIGVSQIFVERGGVYELLTPPAVGRNSFHLDFSDGVKDQSGLGNDWTGNNVGISGDGPASSPVWESGDSGWTIASGGGSASEGGSNGYQDVFTGLMEVGKVYAFTTSHNDGDQNGGWFFADSNSTSLSGTHPNQGRGSNSIGQRGRSSGHSDENNAGAHGTFATANGVTAGDSNLSGFSVINPEGSDTINWVVDRVVNKVWVKRSTDSAWIQGGNPSDAESSPSFHLPATGDLYFGFVQYNNSNLTISIAAYSFTASGRASDIFVDSPVNGNEASTGAGGERRGNYCCLNPLDAPGCTLTNGNLNISCGGSKNGRGTIWPSSGKWYFEFDITTYGNPYVGIGSHGEPQHYVSKNSIAINNTGHIYVSTDGTQSYPGYSVALNATGSYMCAFDLDNGKIWWGKDGTWYKQHTSANTTTTKSEVEAGNGATVFSGHPSFGEQWTVQFGTSSNTSAYSFNAGQRAFKYPSSVPSGYSPLATSFLPEPSESAKHPHNGVDVALFNANNGVSQSIPLSFSPDLVWTKSRAGNHEPQIFDKLRGDDQEMSTNVARASRNLAGSFTFNDDGFTLPSSNNNANYGTGASMAWAWDAGESTTTIAAGSLNSSIYDQSQTWSSGITSGSSPNSGYGVANAFNGGKTGLNNTCFVNNSSHVQVDFTTLSSASTVTVHYTANGSGVLKVNGTNQTIDGSGTNVYRSVTVNVSGLSSVRWEQADGSNFVGVSGIEVDGKLLVDNGVTLANVPSIASTVRANPSYGFSISKASVAASLTGGPTVAHGLQKKPEFIIGKNIDSTIYWYAYHKDLTDLHYLIPHLTSGEQNSGAVWGYHDSLDANKFQIGAGTPASMWIPSGTHDCIFYAWTSIEGFCKIGSFINPSSSDGAFVNLGFKPALIFAKCAINISSSNNLGDWVVKDSSRSPYNNPSDGNTLIWNENYSEDGYYAATQVAIDILSNGFKIRHPNSSPLGDTGRRYVFAAWAENPFASNNRAV